MNETSRISDYNIYSIPPVIYLNIYDRTRAPLDQEYKKKTCYDILKTRVVGVIH